MTNPDSGRGEKAVPSQVRLRPPRFDERSGDVANGEVGSAASGTAPTMSGVDPVQELETNRRLIEQLLAERRSVIQAARESGASWEVIGAALGISRQGAHDWYTRKNSQLVRVGADIDCPVPREADDSIRHGERAGGRVASRRIVHRAHNAPAVSESRGESDSTAPYREWSSIPVADGGRAS